MSSLDEAITISAFRSARASDPAVGTIFAKIIKGTRYVDGDHLMVEDFSGSLELWVPRSLHHRGTGVNKWFAFDVLAEPEPCAVVDLVQGHAKNALSMTKSRLFGKPSEERHCTTRDAARSVVVSDQRPVENS